MMVRYETEGSSIAINMSIAHNEEIRKIKYKNLMCKSVLKCLTSNGYNGRVFVGCISRTLDIMKHMINKPIKPIKVHSDKPYIDLEIAQPIGTKSGTHIP